MRASIGSLRHYAHRPDEKSHHSHDSDFTHVEDHNATKKESEEVWRARHDYYTRFPNAWARIRYASLARHTSRSTLTIFLVDTSASRPPKLWAV